ncbi:MAG: winged helix-turn-helix transcriptional regulator [Candidatus Aenigmatarchaeota archaeon]
MFSPLTLAQIQFYSADNALSKEGKTFVKKIITFYFPEKTFEFSIFGKIENFQASSNAGPVSCEVKSEAVSIVKCFMNLTPEKRTLELSYETFDFVKKIDKKFYFNGDFSIYKNITSAYFAVRLPEGAAISSDLAISSILPENYQTVSDGRRIIVQWNMNNISSAQSLKLQVIYEEVTSTIVGLTLQQLLLASVLAAAGTGLFLYKRIKKPKEVILSVLDENERKVIEILSAAGGELNQKRIVQETNLSKAKVSRLIKSLSQRGLIEVQRTGRTNKIKLVKTKFME